MTYYPTEAQELINELGVCGCGIPQVVYKAIHQMLERANGKQKLINDVEETPYTYYMAYILSDKGFTEHGGGVIHSWLTDKGIKLLDALREYEKYNYDFDEVMEKAPEYFWRTERYERR